MIHQMVAEVLSNDNLSLWPVVLSVVAVLAVIWLTVSRRSRNLPPGLPALPVVGSIPFLGLTGKNDQLRYTELAKKYGHVFSFWLANKPVVVLNGYDAIRAALLDQSITFARRPMMKGSPLVECSNPHSLGISESDYTPRWKKEHMVSLAILRDFGFGRNIMETRIQDEVDSLVQHIRELNGSPCNLKLSLFVSAGNVIGSIMLGKRFPINDCEPPKEQLTAMDTVSKTCPQCVPLTISPQLAYLPSYKKLLKQFSDGNNSILKFAEDVIIEHEVTHHSGKEDDFIDAFINRMGGEHAREHLMYIIRDVFSAGTETMTGSLQWTLIYMANNPGIQKRVQDELDREVGRGRAASLEDKARLPYTEAVILEVQRHAVLVPGAVPHMADHDTELCGHHIPAETMVLINLWSVLRDPELWTEPDSFRPERFLDDDGKVIHRPEMIPFSLGRRSCMGEVMARQELFLFTCGLIQNFNIRAPPGMDKLNEDGQGFLTRTPLPFEIIAEPRT